MPTLSGTIASKSTIDALSYPGHIVKLGEKNNILVTAIQRRLNESGCGPIEEDGDLGKKTVNAIKLFQIRYADADGLPLKVDGQIGALTWERLFGTATIPVTIESPEGADLISKALAIAITQIGNLEKPLGTNRGPEVDLYLNSVGLDPTKGSYSWCAAFVYWCFSQAAIKMNKPNPVIKTAGVLDHWRKANAKKIHCITNNQAVNNPSLITPGQIFIIDYGSGLGHTGIVERVVGGKLITIEGNTNDGGSREGIGVFRREQRKISQINKGFIAYS